jgi:predicted P-loop ATPase
VNKQHETFRLALLSEGYDPIPLNGKAPKLDGWQKLTDSTRDDVISWTTQRRHETNTGVLTKRTPTFDIDIPEQAAADAVEQLVRDRYTECGVILARFGRAPKRAIPFRTDKPFKKITATLVAPNGETHRLEFLGDGQQFVVDGIHPDTRRPYSWVGGELGAVGRDNLPRIDEAEARQLVDDAIELLVAEHGYALTEKAPPLSEVRTPTPTSGGASSFHQLNDAAIANYDRWVPKLFPGAKRHDAGWRVTSATLGRDLEEDISLSPEGIKDFGVHDMGDPRGGKRTPIDVVMEWHPDLRVPIAEIVQGQRKEEFGQAVDWLWAALGHTTNWREEFDARLEEEVDAANKAGLGDGGESVRASGKARVASTRSFASSGDNSETKANTEEEDLGTRSLASKSEADSTAANDQPSPQSVPQPQPTRALRWRECKKGSNKPTASLHNARAAIARLGIECRYDRFHETVLVGYSGGEVWHDIRQLVGELSDIAEARLRQMVSARFGFDPTAVYVHDAIKTLALENSFDPVLYLLDAAQANWDGVPRLDRWVVTYLSCEDTRLSRAIGRKVLVAAVRRARKPGCKFDNITVLEGDEGLMKSTAIRVLAGDENFSDQGLLGARDKEVQELLAGVWMHENADLAGMRRADVEHVKAFASRQVDRARPAYGRVTERRPRRSIEWGTTNNSEYLQSQTGNRRFWPLRVGKVIKIDELVRDRLQLLGEAATYEAEGESVVLDWALWPDAAEAQEARRVKHPWEDILADIPDFVSTWADGDDGVRRQVATAVIHHEHDGTERVASKDLLEHVLKVPAARQTTADSMRLADAMRALGWQRSSNGKVAIGGRRVAGFWRVESGAQTTIPIPGV